MGFALSFFAIEHDLIGCPTQRLKRYSRKGANVSEFQSMDLFLRVKEGPVRIGRPREKLREAASRKRGVALLALLALREAVGAAKLRTYGAPTQRLRRQASRKGSREVSQGLARVKVSQGSRKGQGLADRVRPGYAKRGLAKGFARFREVRVSQGAVGPRRVSQGLAFACLRCPRVAVVNLLVSKSLALEGGLGHLRHVASKPTEPSTPPANVPAEEKCPRPSSRAWLLDTCNYRSSMPLFRHCAV